MSAAPPARPERPTPVTRERIAAYLQAEGYHTRADEDGDVTGVWNGHRFWFILLGERDEVLQVRGRAEHVLPVERRSAALLAVNDWNRDRIWPKAYLREEDDGLALYGEMSVDLEHGVTDAQLALLLDCGLATSIQLFRATAPAQPG
ncbi:YbjN domain-containing protein [Isoptericola sp. b441]|uniref:YbjN domain-containing protein n=1 Tax=Actinotalea lenta TaxID=3064654 RepID=A0ABT9DB67_9CELL|nr:MULTISPECIES: YbjN domain-containing protein [unclassified Isoptericola]MDO8107393.1 YbjN domain-containing protein [Isoptericola sp. b441]MDO8120944.1 YbjN domain-containing protein [Isoptericola sp. b490]